MFTFIIWSTSMSPPLPLPPPFLPLSFCHTPVQYFLHLAKLGSYPDFYTECYSVIIFYVTENYSHVII